MPRTWSLQNCLGQEEDSRGDNKKEQTEKNEEKTSSETHTEEKTGKEEGEKKEIRRVDTRVVNPGKGVQPLLTTHHARAKDDKETQTFI